MFEKNHQGYCGHKEDLIILGSGGINGVGKNNRFYNGYYCPKCKKVYYEDYYFAKPCRLFYTKKGTIDELKYRKLNSKEE